MAEYYCAQCGKRKYGEGLCDECERHRRNMEEHARSAAQAAWDAADAQAGRQQREEEWRKRKEEEQQRRQAEERKRDDVALFVSYPDRILNFLTNSQLDTDDGKLSAISNVLRLFAWDDPEATLGELHDTSPLEADLAYARLRRTLVPILLDLWEARAGLPPTAMPALQKMSHCLLYQDISGVKAFLKERRGRVALIKDRLATREREIAALNSRLYEQAEKEKEVRKEMYTLLLMACGFTLLLALMFVWMGRDAGGVVVPLVGAIALVPLSLKVLYELSRLYGVLNSKSTLEAQRQQVSDSLKEDRGRSKEEVKALTAILHRGLPPELVDRQLQAIVDANRLPPPWNRCGKCGLFFQQLPTVGGCPGCAHLSKPQN